MLTTTFKNKDKIISHFFLQDYTRKHNTESGNPNLKHFSPLLGFSIDLKKPFWERFIVVSL